MSQKVRSVKVYPEDHAKLLYRKIDSNAKSIADIVHKLIEDEKKPQGG